QEIFAHKRREIDRFRPRQLCMHGKSGHSNFVYKFFKARHATQLYWLRKRASRPECASSNAQVDIEVQRASATNSLCFEVVDRAIFVPVQMQALRGNLFEMNFHSATLSTVIS